MSEQLYPGKDKLKCGLKDTFWKVRGDGPS